MTTFTLRQHIPTFVDTDEKPKQASFDSLGSLNDKEISAI